VDSLESHEIKAAWYNNRSTRIVQVDKVITGIDRCDDSCGVRRMVNAT